MQICAKGLAGNTVSLDVAVQLTLAQSHMAALSAAKGQHAVVEQGGRLSTPFAALFSIATPSAVANIILMMVIHGSFVVVNFSRPPRCGSKESRTKI